MNLKVTASHIAGTVAKPPTVAGWKWGLLAASLAVGLIPVVGPGIGHIFNMQRHSSQAHDKKEALAYWYRAQIGAQLGVDPDKVGVAEFEKVAKPGTVFREMLDKVDKEQRLDNRASLAGAVVATPFSIMGAGTLTQKAVEMGLSTAAGAATSLIGKDYLLVDDVASYINEKRLAGNAVTLEDVFFLKLAHDKPLQEAFKKQNGGVAFHKMTEGQQALAIRTSSPYYYQHAKDLAHAVNSGQMTEQDLVLAAGKTNSWVAAQTNRARAGSFVDSVNKGRAEQRAAMALGSQQPA